MPITIEPESGIPFPFDTNPEEIEQFRERAKAAVATIKEIIELGGEVEITKDDQAQARSAASSSVPLRITEKNAGALVHLEAILSEYDKELLNYSTRLRSYVTNKLLLETIDEDARVRLKALELLGKVSTVGLFSEKLQVEVKHRKIEDIDAEIETILEKYVGQVEEVKEDDELDKVIKEKSLLEMSDAEIGIAPQDLEPLDADPREDRVSSKE